MNKVCNLRILTSYVGTCHAENYSTKYNKTAHDIRFWFTVAQLCLTKKGFASNWFDLEYFQNDQGHKVRGSSKSPSPHRVSVLYRPQMKKRGKLFGSSVAHFVTILVIPNQLVIRAVINPARNQSVINRGPKIVKTGDTLAFVTKLFRVLSPLIICRLDCLIRIDPSYPTSKVHLYYLCPF